MNWAGSQESTTSQPWLCGVSNMESLCGTLTNIEVSVNSSEFDMRANFIWDSMNLFLTTKISNTVIMAQLLHMFRKEHNMR